MTPELERGIKRHQQWFGSYKKSGELKKIHVWLTVNEGCIEFLTPSDSFKAKRIRRNPRVICFVGGENGPSVPGTAEIVNDVAVMQRECIALTGRRTRFPCSGLDPPSTSGSNRERGLPFGSSRMSLIRWLG